MHCRCSWFVSCEHWLAVGVVDLDQQQLSHSPHLDLILKSSELHYFPTYTMLSVEYRPFHCVALSPRPPNIHIPCYPHTASYQSPLLQHTRTIAACHVPCPSCPAAPLSKAAGNGVFILLLLNVIMFVLDHVLHIKGIHSLYLNHAKPQWYQVGLYPSSLSAVDIATAAAGAGAVVGPAAATAQW